MRAPHAVSVMVVEDEPDQALFAERAVISAGLDATVVSVSTGEDALAQLAPSETTAPADGGLPHVLFLDVKMPGISGLEVLQTLRAKPATRLLPIVMLTTDDDPDRIAEAYRLGASGYIVKPTSYPVFEERIRAALVYWLTTVMRPVA